jgi:hypothetical protein
MVRRYLRLLAFVLGVAFMATGTAAIAGCGTPVASPEHLGRWFGNNDAVAVTITVAGTPDHYTAKVVAAKPPSWGYDEGAGFRGGEADAAGNVVFDTVTLEPEGANNTTLDLTLSPVSGDTMTVHFTIIGTTDQTVEVKRL